MQDRLNSRPMIEQRVCQVILTVADWLPNNQEVLQSDSLKNDLGFDSLALVHLQVAIEDEFGFRFDPVRTDFISVFDKVVNLITFLIEAGIANEERS